MDFLSSVSVKFGAQFRNSALRAVKKKPAIRAIYNIKLYYRANKRPISATSIRKKLEIPSIEVLRTRALSMEAWKYKDYLRKMELEQLSLPNTRQWHVLHISKETGHQKHSILPKIVKTWKEMPAEIKQCLTYPWSIVYVCKISDIWHHFHISGIILA